MTLQDDITEAMKDHLPAEVLGNIASAAQAAIDVVERRLLSDEMAKIGTEVFVSDFDYRSIKGVLKHVWKAVKEGSHE